MTCSTHLGGVERRAAASFDVLRALSVAELQGGARAAILIDRVTVCAASEVPLATNDGAEELIVEARVLGKVIRLASAVHKVFRDCDGSKDRCEDDRGELGHKSRFERLERDRGAD